MSLATLPIEAVLRELRSTLDEDRWCREALARASDGTMRRWTDEAAVQWCVVGHIHRAVRTVMGEDSSRQKAAVRIVHGLLEGWIPETSESLESYNDNATTRVTDLHTLVDSALHELEAHDRCQDPATP